MGSSFTTGAAGPSSGWGRVSAGPSTSSVDSTQLLHGVAPPYAAKGPRPLKKDRDYIFRSGGNDLILLLTIDAQGYRGTLNIGLQIT
jgi:hypothetical protein